jgi:hypothetical protein
MIEMQVCAFNDKRRPKTPTSPVQLRSFFRTKVTLFNDPSNGGFEKGRDSLG